MGMAQQQHHPQQPVSEYAPTATDERERERERERKGRREILGMPVGRERTGSVVGRRRGIF
jgi:hypothetical protein